MTRAAAKQHIRAFLDEVYEEPDTEVGSIAQ